VRRGENQKVLVAWYTLRIRRDLVPVLAAALGSAALAARRGAATTLARTG
jgi:hypothetical protein